MGNKSALKITSINGNDTTASAGSPFWASKDKKKKITFKFVMGQVWKWIKILIFLFMMLMGLWGCFQSMAESKVAQSSTLGTGLEFGFPFASTGDYRFDLQMGIDAHQYNTFSTASWTCSVKNGYGPFYGLFVWPAAYVVTKFMWATRTWVAGLNALLAIFLLLLFIRLLSLALTIKSTIQNERMTEVQGQIAEINAKYKDLKDSQSRMMKQQETMALYKKHNIKPFAAFEQMFITLPIFLIVFRVVTIVRPIKVTVLFNIWNFALSPLNQVFTNFLKGGWTYIFFLILVAGSQVASMKVPQIWAKKRSRQTTAVSAAGEKQMKKSNRTQLIFMIVMCVIVCFSAVGVGVYWFLNSLFSIAQAGIMHAIIMKKRRAKMSSPTAKITSFTL